MTALALVLIAVQSKGCPVEVEISMPREDGTFRWAVFSRRRSLVGTGLAFAQLEDVFESEPPVCMSERPYLCRARVLAAAAKEVFMSQGCDESHFTPSSQHNQKLDFLQVGAHIGNSTLRGEALDPIFDFIRADHSTDRVSAVLVEPLQDSFEKLVQNYKGSSHDLYYEHAAVVPDDDYDKGGPFVLWTPPPIEEEGARLVGRRAVILHLNA